MAKMILLGPANSELIRSASDISMGEISKFPKFETFKTPILKLAVCPLNIHNFKFKWSIVLRQTEYNQRTYYNLPNSAF